MALPSVGVFVSFVALSVLFVGLISLTQWTGFDLSQIRWAGLDNYSNLANDPVFWRSLRQTLLYTGICTVLLNVAGFSLAYLVHTRVRGSGLLKAIIFVPVLMSPVVVGLMWSNLLRGNGGALNELLAAIGLTSQPIFFLGEQPYAFAAIVFATVWQFTGLNMILYYAGLQGLSPSLMEAAALDGASRWATIRHVVLPSLYPVISVITLLNIIGCLREFDIMFVLTRGGPERSTEVLATYMYEQAFSFSNMGKASAIAMVIVVIAVGVSLLRLRLARHVG